MSGLWRLAIVYSAIAAFTCFGLYSLTASWHLRHDREALLEELERVGEVLLAGVETTSPQSFTELTENLAGASYRVTVIGGQGEVLADSWFEGEERSRLTTVSGRAEVIQARQQGTGEAFRFSTAVGEEMAFRAFRLPDGDLIFRIGRTYRPNQTREHQIRWSFVLAGVLLVGALLLLIRSTQRQWNESAQILIEGAQEIAGGEFPQRLPLVTLRPMGKVARAIEDLAAKTRTRIERLEAERDHLSTVLSSMLEGVLVVDRRGRISDSNPAFREMFRVQSPPRGKLPLEVIRVASVSDQISQVLSSGETAWDEIRSEGRVLRVHFTPVGSEPTTGVVVVFNDITDLRRLEQLRKEFVSNVSHELKTPLTAIQGYAETLSEEREIDPLHRQFLDKMVRNSQQLSNMIDQLLNLARIESQSHDLALETLDFSEVVAQLQEEFNESLEEKGLDFSWSAPEDSQFVADRSYLYQVFRNLLENAIKYTEKGKITLRMQEGDGQWLFSVEDTGIGIPEADLERIFERFYRVHKDRSRATGGSGIGLAIVKHIVQIHQGEVWAESRLNTGSRLCFTIPVVKA